MLLSRDKIILTFFCLILLLSCYRPNHSATADNSQSNNLQEAQYNWNMVTTWPPNFPIIQEACDEFANRVEIATQGRVKIHVYAGGELIPALEVFDAVSTGTAVLGHSSAYYWSGKVPAAQFFSTVPFGLNALNQNTWIQYGGGIELYREIYAPHNLYPFLAGNTCAQMGGWFNKEINTIEDFSGLKMRIPGLGGKILKKVGGTPVLLSGGEIYTSLERGIIDATEWLGPYHDSFMGFADISKYYYAPGWHEMGTTLELIVNKQVYESLPEDLKILLDTESAWLNQTITQQMQYYNSTYLEKLRNQGVDIRIFSPEVLAALKKASDEVIQEMCDEDPEILKVVTSLNTYKKAADDYFTITETPLINIQ